MDPVDAGLPSAAPVKIGTPVRDAAGKIDDAVAGPEETVEQVVVGGLRIEPDLRGGRDKFEIVRPEQVRDHHMPERRCFERGFANSFNYI